MAQQPPRRDPGHQSGRDHERNNPDEEDEEESEGESGSATPQRRGRRAPTNKLNMYMRAVAVVALLIVGGVGVYKGRTMFSAKETGPKIAKVKDPTKFEAVDPKPTEVKPADGKTEASPKAGSSTKPPSFTANSSSFGTSKKSSDDTKKKPSALMNALNKEKQEKGGVAAASPPSGSDSKKFGLGGYKFGGAKEKDSAKSEATPPDGHASDPMPTEATPGGYTDEPAVVEGTGDDSTRDNALAANDGGYEAATQPRPRSGGFSLNDDASASVGDDTQDQQPPAEVAETSDPIPAAPSFGGAGSFGTRGNSLADAGSSSSSDLRTPPPRNTLPDTSSTGGSRLGTITDSPAAGSAERSPARLLPGGTLPPSRLATNPRERALTGSNATTDERYGAANDDITPVPSSSAPIDANLTGLQTPSIAVEKFAPEEVQVGKPATFEIVVKNVGKVPAYDVTVQDVVPAGTRFQQATPQASQTQGGGLVWKLGVIQPGQEQVIELQLVPEKEGEIGSVAQVTFQSKAASKSIVTQPRLEIAHDAPPQVHAGDVALVRLTITNSGTGAASNLVLASDVPEGFTHEAGSSLETKVNPLRPGESTQISLNMKAIKAGHYQQGFSLEEEDGKVVAQDSADIEVVAPALDVAIAGPKKRYIERQATHNITIANPGTASAKDVDLVAYLPQGFKFVSAAPAAAGGQYDARQHAVVWGLEELVAGASATVQLTTMPVEAGDQKVRVEARSPTGLAADFEQLVEVDAISELPFTIHDLADPIEIGSETAYEIRLSNRGAKDATNVAVSVTFPPELKPLDGEGAAQATVAGDRVEFAPIGRIAPGQEVVFKVRAEGLRAGDHRIAVSLTSDDQREPITREESTRVYADQ